MSAQVGFFVPWQTADDVSTSPANAPSFIVYFVAKMGVLDLPVELLKLIVEQTLSGSDFPQFLLSCKDVYLAGKEYIPRYKYRCIELYDRQKRKSLSISKLLLDISKDPGIIEHTEVLSFWHPEVCGRPDFDNEHIPAIRSFLQGSSCGLSPAIKAALERAFDYTSQSYHYASSRIDHICHILSVALLAMASNVRELAHPVWSEMGYKTFETGEHLQSYYPMNELTRTFTRECNTPTGPLRQLAALRPTVRCSGDSHPESNDGAEVTTLLPFVTFPSLKSIAVLDSFSNNEDDPNQNAEDWNEQKAFLWPFGPTQSNLTSIDMISSSISAATIAELLSHTPHLTTFHYSHSANREDYHTTDGWDGPAFVDAVADNRDSQVIDLAITIDYMGMTFAPTSTYLDKFTAVKKLEIDLPLFFDEACYTPSIKTSLPQDIDLVHVPHYWDGIDDRGYRQNEENSQSWTFDFHRRFPEANDDTDYPYDDHDPDFPFGNKLTWEQMSPEMYARTMKMVTENRALLSSDRA